MKNNKILFEENLSKILHSKSKILITTHYNPDGDAIGSSLALYEFFIQHDLDVNILIPNIIPDFLTWLSRSNESVIFQENKDLAKKLISQSDYIFCLDFNNLNRVKLYSEELKESKSKKFVIDHHIDQSSEFDFYYTDTNTSSTAELVYDIISGFEVKNSKKYFNKSIAEALFVGIVTDTGSFAYSCNRKETFEKVSNLIEFDLNINKIHQRVYNTFSENRIRLIGHALSSRLKVFEQHHTAYIWLSEEDLKKYGYQQGDTEGLVNYTLSIKDICLGALFIERSDRIRISLRSIGNFSVNDMALKHFNGGGHKNAAGGELYISLEEALQYFENILPEYSASINKEIIEFYK